MNIAYQGLFLHEGLKLLGHNVIDVSFSKDEDIQKTIEDLNCKIDFILIELWGDRILPKELFKCKYTLVAYCIDSPINEFWTTQLCRIFDFVFVDQKQSVYNFLQHGINAVWLPLCIHETSFCEINPNKKYDITFVGTTSTNRIKRKNILALLQQNFNLNVIQGVSHSQMMKLFAESKIVLNENLFSGLTLRVFQGLASGSLVLTEEGGCGVDDYFRNGEHLLCYNPDNLLRICEDILSSYDSYADIATNGYMLCKREHTAKNRASSLLEAIQDKTAFNKRPDTALGNYHETLAKHLLIMRYGGQLNNTISKFTELTTENNYIAAGAFSELGNIMARHSKNELAEQYYISSLNKNNTIQANIKLALLYINTEKIQDAKSLLQNIINTFSVQNKSDYGDIATLIERSTDSADLLFVVALLYFSCGNLFSLGFLKPLPDKYPDTAFEAALLAWNKKPIPAAMNLLLDCLKGFNIEGEMLPQLLEAIQKVQLTDRQILRAAEIAKQYYDIDLANNIITAFRTSMKKS
ncbi:MAG: glycosyltransferase [Deltaproteobacteria bacterium]|jgi:hypothetical protein|nr:glycosyltransferase [Deltaproteobacteria bacterium]